MSLTWLATLPFLVVSGAPLCSESPVGLCQDPPFESGETAYFEVRVAGVRVGEGAARLTRSWASWPEIPTRATPWNEPRWLVVGSGHALPPLSHFVSVEAELRAFMHAADMAPDYRELRMDYPWEHALRREVFDPSADAVWFWRERFRHRRRDKEGITRRRNPFFHDAYDPISLYFHLRCRGAVVGERLERVVHENGKNLRVLIDIEAREILETVLGPISALRVAMQIFSEQGEAKFKRPLLLWVSADSRFIPLRFELDLKFANIAGRLVAYRQGAGKPTFGEARPPFSSAP